MSDRVNLVVIPSASIAVPAGNIEMLLTKFSIDVNHALIFPSTSIDPLEFRQQISLTTEVGVLYIDPRDSWGVEPSDTPASVAVANADEDENEADASDNDDADATDGEADLGEDSDTGEEKLVPRVAVLQTETALLSDQRATIEGSAIYELLYAPGMKFAMLERNMRRHMQTEEINRTIAAQKTAHVSDGGTDLAEEERADLVIPPEDILKQQSRKAKMMAKVAETSRRMANCTREEVVRFLSHELRMSNADIERHLRSGYDLLVTHSRAING